MCVYRAVIVCVRVCTTVCVCARGQEVRFGVSALWPESLFGHEVSFQPLNLLVEYPERQMSTSKTQNLLVDSVFLLRQRVLGVPGPRRRLTRCS